MQTRGSTGVRARCRRRSEVNRSRVGHLEIENHLQSLMLRVVYFSTISGVGKRLSQITLAIFAVLSLSHRLDWYCIVAVKAISRQDWHKLNEPSRSRDWVSSGNRIS